MEVVGGPPHERLGHALWLNGRAKLGVASRARLEIVHGMCHRDTSQPRGIKVILRKRALAALIVMVALGLCAGGCTPSGPTNPSPTPTPAFSPTETRLERQTRLDFEAAEKSYRTFSAEFDRLANAGGAKEPSKLMKETGAGPILKLTAAALKAQYNQHAKVTGKRHIVRVERGGYAPDRLMLLTCEDASSIRSFDTDGKSLGKGSVGTSTVEVRRLDDRWKFWNTSDDKAVSSCAG
jgi:hypothetical protein